MKPDKSLSQLILETLYMHNWNDILATLLQELEREIGKLMEMEAISFQTADPPSLPGVYIIYDHCGTLAYVGEASGSGGLKDRLK